jgi:hypothetical protein
MGTDGIMAAVKKLNVYPMTPETAHALLRTLPRDVVVHVARNMAKVALSRQELILKLVEEIELGVDGNTTVNGIE